MTQHHHAALRDALAEVARTGDPLYIAYRPNRLWIGQDQPLAESDEVVLCLGDAPLPRSLGAGVCRVVARLRGPIDFAEACLALTGLDPENETDDQAGAGPFDARTKSGASVALHALMTVYNNGLNRLIRIDLDDGAEPELSPESQLRAAIFQAAERLERFDVHVSPTGTTIAEAVNARDADISVSGRVVLHKPGYVPDVAFGPIKKVTGHAPWKLRDGEDLPRRLVRAEDPDAPSLLLEGVARVNGDSLTLRLRARPATGRVGLVIGRFQPLHHGHVATIQRMLDECDVAIVCVGSSQLKGQVRHPFSWETRERMLRAVFGRRIRVLPLIDLNSLESTDDWTDYVLGKISDMGLPAPTDLYAGSIVDVRWYGRRFAGDGKRLTRNDDAVHSYETEDGARRLHICHDSRVNPLSATDLRTLIELRDPEWRSYVPEAVHDMIERHYPGDLRLPLELDHFPEDVPAGTRVIRTDAPANRYGGRYALDDEGQWTAEAYPLSPQAD